MSKKKQQTLWVFDMETDPFKYEEVPAPFLVVTLSEHGDCYIFWGDDALPRFNRWVMELENSLMLAHNGGKFDVLFMKDILVGNMLVADGRIIKCSPKKGVEIRDSMAILPMALKKLGAKYEIDIKKLLRENREQHKQEIIRYCKQDCTVLLEKVMDFYRRAGCRRLTIAGQASNELRTHYPDLPKLGEKHHREFSQFFFGGRVQCFERGIIKLKRGVMVDRNSMYPAEMAFSNHPYGEGYRVKDFSLANLPENNCGFFVGTVDSNGAFPVRQKDKTTPYSIGKNLHICTTLHEVRASIDCGWAKNFRGKIYLPEFSTTFDKFILGHYESRKRARVIGDEGGDLYHKLIPNSSYGRFAMSPDGRDEIFYAERGLNFSDMNDCAEKCQHTGGRCKFSDNEDLREFEMEKRKCWNVKYIDFEAERFIFGRDVSKPWLFYEDVATGASITGASRANLMRNLHAAIRPIYCDTDSILCEGFNGKIGNELGEWKIETECDMAAIAAKKLYVLYNKGEVVKQASKGVRASADQIYRAAAGEVVEVVQDAPIMRLQGNRFLTREIRRV